MALFSSDTKKKAAPVQAKKSKSTTPKGTGRKVLSNKDGKLEHVLKAPHFSEKALIGTERGVYVFEVPASATKTEVASAIKLTYNVTPVKVHMVNLPPKRLALRTRRGVGTRARRHKAYVYLAKGDTITLA